MRTSNFPGKIAMRQIAAAQRRIPQLLAIDPRTPDQTAELAACQRNLTQPSLAHAILTRTKKVRGGHFTR